MPSLLVHLGLSALVAAALLGEAYDRRSLAVVLGGTAFVDLDTFVGIFTDFGHRVAFHTFLLPLALGLLLWYDTAVRPESVVLDRWGPRGRRVAWVALAAWVVSAIGLDFVTGGVNPLFPIHDQFYRLDGKLIVSSTEGLVQTFVETASGSGSVPAPSSLGTSSEVHVSTGIDPTRGSESANVERIFPVARWGWQLLVILVGAGVTVARFRLPQSIGKPGDANGPE